MSLIFVSDIISECGLSVKTTKAKSEQLGKADIEKTRYYPQSQLLTKQAPGITFSKLSFSYQCFI